MSAQNPFPSRANLQGYQTIASTCSETDSIRLYNGNLLKTVTLVNVPTLGLGLKFILKYNSLMSTATASPVGNKCRAPSKSA